MPRFLLLSIGLISLLACACKDNSSEPAKTDPPCLSDDCDTTLEPEFNCDACEAKGGECEDEHCIAPSFTGECTVSTCPRGCCDASGECRIYTQQDVEQCGTSGQSCAVCTSNVDRCVVGTCVDEQPCLSYCRDGCCDTEGQCVGFGEQNFDECGAATSCSPCGQEQRCASGECRIQPVWSVIVRSISISDRAAGGDPWDAETGRKQLPDPYVQSGLGGSPSFSLEGETNVAADTLTPHWDQSKQSRYWILEGELVNKGLEFRVRDSDSTSFQMVGECTMSVSAEELIAGTKTQPVCGVGNLARDLRVDFAAQ